jgi:peptidoglycan/xylan/chitin deacetylase (PgdA/CDA1 family)
LVAVTLTWLLGTKIGSAQDAPRSPAVRRPVPDRLVVLTFDDAVRSHYTVVRPILKKYGFTATFFVSEGWDFATNKRDYMTWEQIAELHQDGFEIGNHTRDHLGITVKNYGQLPEQLEAIALKCEQHGIPRPVSFAWPGNATTHKAFRLLDEHGIRFARRGGAPEFPYEQGRGVSYEPGKDHPLLLPSAADARPTWTLDDFIRGVEQARDGQIAIIQFHGVPDTAHDWVSTDEQRFEACLRYLHLKHYRVIALRDLDKYVDCDVKPKNHQAVIDDRKAEIERSAESRIRNAR